MDNNFKEKYLKYKHKYFNLHKNYLTKYVNKTEEKKKYSFVIIENDEPVFKEFDNVDEYIKAFEEEKKKGNISENSYPIIN
jgi:hypothetical protein